MLIGQILTVISYLVYYISRFLKEKSNIILLGNISKIFTILSFIFLKSYDGIVSTIYSLVRDVCGRLLIKRDLIYKQLSFIVLTIVLVIISSFNFNGLSTLCVDTTMLLNTFGVLFLKPQGMRVMTMIGSLFYSAFQFSIGNIAGFICELGTLTVNFVSYMKYRKK